MAEIELSQAEADYLLALEKRRVDDGVYPFPTHGEEIRLGIKALYEDEYFLLDVSRGSQ